MASEATAGSDIGAKIGVLVKYVSFSQGLKARSTVDLDLSISLSNPQNARRPLVSPPLGLLVIASPICALAPCSPVRV